MKKNKWIAFVWCSFLGAFGAHRFYVGRTGSAVAMLVMSFTVILLPVTGVWSLVDWIMILSGNFKDADGNIVTA